MPKIPRVSGKECLAALKKLGYRVERETGDHKRLVCEGRSPVTVPMYDEIGPGLMKKILREAGISTEDFILLLKEKFK